MVAQTVSVEIDGATLNAALARMAAVLADPSAFLDQIGRYLVASTQRRFERGRAPDGSPWLQSARALAEDRQTLTDTGRLRGSIAHTVTDGGRAVEVGSNVIYAAIHQFGWPRRQGAAGNNSRTPLSRRRRARPGQHPVHRFARAREGGNMTLAALEMHLADAMAERLTALEGEDGAPVFAAVLSALDTAALTAWPKTPAALVLPVSDEAEESTTRRVENPPVQHVVRVGVSVMVAAPNDRSGARGRGRLSALLAHARQALAGWTPPGQREVLSFRRGRLVSLEDGRLQWLDEYEIRRIARAGVVEAE